MGTSVSLKQLLPIRPIPIGPASKLEPSIWALHTSVASTGQRVQSCCSHHRRFLIRYKAKCQNHKAQPQFNVHQLFGYWPIAPCNAEMLSVASGG